MNSKPVSSNSTKSNDVQNNNNVSSKWRRLKIEENLLLQSLENLDSKRNYEVTESEQNNISNHKDLKNMLKYLKDSYININNLFDEVKTVTCSQELLAELEIDEIKKKVIELETTMKSFKAYLNNELSALKTAEQELTTQAEEINSRETKMVMRKIQSANYNQVVPSPVRLLMTSPFKCPEVQEFQDFMKNSPNRYGGWNEYHHNIFIKYWQKYFGTSANTDFVDSLVENLTYENFIEEVLFKLEGVNKDSIMSHIEWYKKYLILKYNQQKAIDKWKSTKRLLKNVTKMATTTNSEKEKATNNQIISTDNIDLLDFNQIACDFVDISTEEQRKLDATLSRRKSQYCIEMKKKVLKQTKPPVRKLSGQDYIERLTKPTKQWLSRSHHENEHKIQQINFIGNMEKLRIPNWRQYLSEMNNY